MEKPLKMCQRSKEGWGIRIFRTQQKSLLLRDVKDIQDIVSRLGPGEATKEHQSCLFATQF